MKGWIKGTLWGTVLTAVIGGVGLRLSWAGIQGVFWMRDTCKQSERDHPEIAANTAFRHDQKVVNAEILGHLRYLRRTADRNGHSSVTNENTGG